MSASAPLLGDERTSGAPAFVVPGALSTAICSGLPTLIPPGDARAMGTKSRETIYGGSVRAAAERATEARKQADRLACEAWNKRMLAFNGPAQPSPTLGDALNGVTSIWKSGASAATPIKPSPSTLCGDRRRRRSTSLNATCAVASARKSGAIRTSEAIWWRCARPRSRRAIRRRTGGLGKDKKKVINA